MIRIVSIFLVSIAALVLIGGQFRDELTPADRKILFVGNSFIHGENVPHMVQQLAASNVPPVKYYTRLIALGGARLIDHQKIGDAAREIESGVWDVIVLQDQSSTAFSPEMHADSDQAIAHFAKLAEAAGSELVYYAHWPPETVAGSDNTWAVAEIEGMYARAMERHGGTLAYVGDIWLRAWAEDMTGLYDTDLHHASRLGAFAAALAVIDALGDVSAAETKWVPGRVGEDEVQQIRVIAGSCRPGSMACR
jgi:hypothetical protein